VRILYLPFLTVFGEKRDKMSKTPHSQIQNPLHSTILILYLTSLSLSLSLSLPMDKLNRCAKALQSLPASSVPSGIDGADVSRAYKSSSSSSSFHMLPADEVCALLGVDPRRGLDAATAATRLDKYGPNSPSAAETALLGCEAWLQQLVMACVVVRSGQPMEVPPQQLVVGDVVVLEAGERVPADVRIVFAETTLATQYIFAAGEGWRTTQAEMPTAVDAAVPNGLGPQNVTSGERGQKERGNKRWFKNIQNSHSF